MGKARAAPAVWAFLSPELTSNGDKYHLSVGRNAGVIGDHELV